MITQKDIQQLNQKGIRPEQIDQQLLRFKEGFPFLDLHASATEGNGIRVMSDAEIQRCQHLWDAYMGGSRRVLKFVPASGAASRMFKDLFAFLDSDHEGPQSAFEKHFFENLHQFAFAEDLDAVCKKQQHRSLEEMMRAHQYKEIVRLLLDSDGLNYGVLPKGLLAFHRYPDGARLAVAEHLVEGALYAKGNDGKVYVHFTVSEDHLSLFQQAVAKVAPVIAKAHKLQFDVGYSIQKASTDTLAADAQNQPFRADDGSLLFRPGGHGALIENMNDLDADIVFVKNIDNVVPDRLKADTVTYKKVLAGLLVDVQQRIFDYLDVLERGQYTHEDLLEMIHFLQQDLCTRNPETKLLEDSELALYLKSKFNRPVRVCGMVKNQGEPGGGPFWAYNSDGTYSLQILESSQIDMQDPKKKALFEQGTHFNPVDLVCAIKDFKGNPFHLPDFVDPATGFISNKSKGGKELKALELPGLWNGAMSDWSTLFVEVPLSTFNPVKTVNDLLRSEHQA